MQFTTIFALAAAIVGVSANVHSECQCVFKADGSVDTDTTAKACKFYPRDELYTSNEKVITDTSIISNINLVVGADGWCESQDLESGDLVEHLGGDQFETACTRNAPDNVKVESVCN